jgi:hypothetical protein
MEVEQTLMTDETPLKALKKTPSAFVIWFPSPLTLIFPFNLNELAWIELVRSWTRKST